ncbi:MAG: hypothetical protein H6550_10605 [Chitinophagales bacterium]|nr:hypothetical protein [Chitinophagales bacterium]
MRNTIITVAALLLIFAISCQKKDSTKVVYIADTTNTDTPKVTDDSYYIPGLADKTVNSFSQLDIDFTVTQNTITDTRVYLSLGDLPTNTYGNISVKSGYPTYNSSLHFDFQFTPPGNYPIKLVTKTENNTQKDYHFNIEVTKPDDQECNNAFLNGYKTSNFNYSDSAYGSVANITPSPLSYEKHLYFYNLVLYTLSSAGVDYYLSYSALNSTNSARTDQIKFDFDCSSGNITIPLQQVIGQYMTLGTSIQDTFNISGYGAVDVKTQSYNITYRTNFDDKGTMRYGKFTMSGDFKL